MRQQTCDGCDQVRWVNDNGLCPECDAYIDEHESDLATGVKPAAKPMPLPRGMSPGFYAFMSPGCVRDESGTLWMSVDTKEEKS